MKKLFKSVFNIRKGEWPLTLLMLTNYYLILVTYYFLKPARDSLFLVKVSSDMLPLVFIITALVTAPVVTFYTKASKKLSLKKLINITTLILIINLFALRWLVQINSTWVYYTFYTWVSIYGALTTSQFWLLANAVYDAGQAKRIFTLIGLAGIIGAFTGGQLTSLVVTKLNVSTENLLFICMGLLAFCILLVTLIWSLKIKQEGEIKRPAPRKEPTQEKFSQIIKTIFRSKHLALTVGIIAMTMMVASFVDFQFKSISYQAFPDKAELTSFLGKFYSWLSLASLILQLLFANSLIRVLGVSGIIMFLPVGLLLGSAALIFYPGLLAVVLLRGADGSIKYSLDKTGRELLFLPIPLEIKKRTKIFIDMFVDRWFRGLAGGLLLLCTLVLKLSMQQISIVVIVLVVIWLVLTLLMRREYVNSFRKAIERRDIDFSELRTHINDKGAIDSLLKSLESKNARQVIYALEMLKSVKDKKIIEPVAKLIKHESNDVRFNALQILKQLGDESYLDQVRPLLADSDIMVRCEAVHFVSVHSQEDKGSVINEMLKDSNPETSQATIACIAEHGEADDFKLITDDIINKIMQDESPFAENGRIQLARVLGAVNNPSYNKYLEKLINDPSHKVVREAIQCIGKLNQRSYIPWLIENLGNRQLRISVRSALASFGTGILGTLSDYLLDNSIDFVIRKNLPRVFTMIAHQSSVDSLTTCLKEIEPALKYYLIKSLNSLRKKHPELKFSQEKLESVMLNETKEYYQIYQILHTGQKFNESDSAKLLRKALQEKAEANLELIFRLLGLFYPPNDIFYAYQGYVSGKRNLQVNAVEFLDNLLKRDVKKYVLPMLEDLPAESIAAKADDLFKVGVSNIEEALENLIIGRDVWLTCCALYHAADYDNDKLKPLILEMTKNSDPLIAETAKLAMNN